jgi:hypothetical protein
MAKQNNNKNTGWEITFSPEKNRLFLCAYYFFRKENTPLSCPGNLCLISVYNKKIISGVLTTAMEASV